MQKLAERIVRFLEKKHVIPESDHEVYVYGFDAALCTTLSTLGLVLIGCLFGRIIETLIMIALFYTNQTLGGGFHAKTHESCFLTMAIGLLGCLLSLSVAYQPVICGIAGAGSLFLLFYFPLVLHPNKAYLYRQKERLVKRSRIEIAVQAVVLIGLFTWGKPVYIQTVCASLCVCAVSRLTAARKESSPD